MQAKKQIAKHDDDDDDVKFIVDAAGDSGLGMSSDEVLHRDDKLHEQADFVSFVVEDKNDENNVDDDHHHYFN